MMRSISSAPTPRLGERIARGMDREIAGRLPGRRRCAARVCRCARRSTHHWCRPCAPSRALLRMRAGRYEPTPSITERRCTPNLMSTMRSTAARGVNANMPVHLGDVGGDLGDKTVLHHFDRNIDGGCEAQRIGAAMTLHHDAVEPQEHAAIVLARIHALAQRRESARGEESAEPRQQRARQSKPEIGGKLLGGAFRRLERDIAGEALGHDHIDGALADIVAFDEARIFERQSESRAGAGRPPSPPRGP